MLTYLISINLFLFLLNYRGLVNIHSIYDELRGRAYLDEDFDEKGYMVQDTLNNESGKKCKHSLFTQKLIQICD